MDENTQNVPENEEAVPQIEPIEILTDEQLDEIRERHRYKNGNWFSDVLTMQILLCVVIAILIVVTNIFSTGISKNFINQCHNFSVNEPEQIFLTVADIFKGIGN